MGVRPRGDVLEQGRAGRTPPRSRELGKLATLKVHLGDALRAHGIDEPAATIAAETAVTVFHLSFTQWITDGEDRDFGAIVHERLDALTRIVHPGS